MFKMTFLENLTIADNYYFSLRAYILSYMES